MVSFELPNRSLATLDLILSEMPYGEFGGATRVVCVLPLSKVQVLDQSHFAGEAGLLFSRYWVPGITREI